MGAHVQEQRFVGLARGVDPEVGQGAGRQQAARGVEGLGADGLAVDEVGVVGGLRELHGQPLGEDRQQFGVGVEHSVHLTDVARTESRFEQVVVPIEAVVAVVESSVVAEIARRLLEVAHETTPLEDFGEDVARLFTGQMDAAQLGHRVVAVLDEDPLVELVGAVESDGRVDRRVTRKIEVADELVEEESAQALGGS